MELNEIFEWQDVSFKMAESDFRRFTEQVQTEQPEGNLHFHLGWEFKLYPEHVLEVIPPFSLHAGTAQHIAVWQLREKELSFSAGNFREEKFADTEEIADALTAVLSVCESHPDTLGEFGIQQMLSVVWKLLLKSIRKDNGGITEIKTAGICELVISYLESNYSRQDLSVEEIASHIGYSAQYLNGKFRSQGLGSLRQFLVKMRLQHAAALLKTGYCSVGMAAQLTGWNNQFYFSNAFRKFYGISPSKFASGISPDKRMV